MVCGARTLAASDDGAFGHLCVMEPLGGGGRHAKCGLDGVQQFVFFFVLDTVGKDH